MEARKAELKMSSAPIVSMILTVGAAAETSLPSVPIVIAPSGLHLTTMMTPLGMLDQSAGPLRMGSRFLLMLLP